MRARDLDCTICGAKVEEYCDLSTNNDTIGSYHKSRVLAAQKVERDTNRMVREAAFNKETTNAR